MNSRTRVARRTPDRTVREEMRIMERLGFRYLGSNSAGHHLFEHPQHGRPRPMSSTPRNPSGWRVSHRREIAGLLGISLWQFERLIAGQATDHKPRKRRRARLPRRRTPLSLVIPRQPARRERITPSRGALPAPGSSAARGDGCSCPVFANRHGEGRVDGSFEVLLSCPLHGEEAQR